MFEKFTKKAKQSIIFAKEECDNYKGDSITTKHLLLGILRFDQEQPAIILQSLGVSITELKQEIQKKLPKNKGIEFNDIPFTSNAARVINAIVASCKTQNCPRIDLGQMLVGLLTVEYCSAARILRKYKVTLKKVNSCIEENKT